ncbi:MAG TPA: cytochrome c-type biogenesis protein CcmH [Gemmatimonadales bacterium]|nr:cytochrome c-type biogenesis protein CcmH [Gemmatimonadales bacterium]
MTGHTSRRQFCAALAGGVLAAGIPPRLRGQGTQTHQRPADPGPLPGAGPAGSLADPDRAGRPLEPITARDNDAALQAIEKRLACTCGCGLDIYTCRTTDFNCTFSPGLHRQILSLAASGMSGDEIIAEFVSEHGESVLMSPPRRGFALFGYYGPWVAVALATTGLVLLLRRWSRRAAAVAAAGAPSLPAPSPDELALVQRELDRFES